MNNLVQQISQARERYRPTRIRCILIAEAPPNRVDRFFYYPDVKKADYLFLGIMGVLYPEDKEAYLRAGRPPKFKERLLRQFQLDGFYLLDLLDIPIQQYTGSLTGAIPQLIQKLQELEAYDTPLILIKASIYDTVAPELIQAGFKVIPVRIVFPAQGWQGEFHKAFARAIHLVERLKGPYGPTLLNDA